MVNMFAKQLLGVLLLLLFAKNLYRSVKQIFSCEFNEQYLEYINDSVARENFSYYIFHNEGSFRLELTSVYGDADIYLSSKQKPGYSPHQHDLAAATCGVDIIDLTKGIGRPVYIGIYGAGHTEWSNYTLIIFMAKENSKGAKELNLKHKLNFIIRYTTMWRIFEFLESISL